MHDISYIATSQKKINSYFYLPEINYDYSGRINNCPKRRLVFREDRSSYYTRCGSLCCEDPNCREVFASKQARINLRNHAGMPFNKFCRFSPLKTLSNEEMKQVIKQLLDNIGMWCLRNNEFIDILLIPHKKLNGALHWDGIMRVSSESVVKQLALFWCVIRGEGRGTYSITNPKCKKNWLTYCTKVGQQYKGCFIKFNHGNGVFRRGKLDRVC